MTLDEWHATAVADADRRQLPDLKPVLKGLRGAAEALRAAAWNDNATGRTDAAAPATTPAAAPAPASSSSSSPSESPRATS